MSTQTNDQPKKAPPPFSAHLIADKGRGNKAWIRIGAGFEQKDRLGISVPLDLPPTAGYELVLKVTDDNKTVDDYLDLQQVGNGPALIGYWVFNRGSRGQVKVWRDMGAGFVSKDRKYISVPYDCLPNGDADLVFRVPNDETDKQTETATGTPAFNQAAGSSSETNDEIPF